jgi:hypothetical protein
MRMVPVESHARGGKPRGERSPAEERAVLARIKTQTRTNRPGWLRRLAKKPPVFFWWWIWQ